VHTSHFYFPLKKVFVWNIQILTKVICTKEKARMTENDEQLQTNTYIWSQSNDQVTITFLVPDSSKAKDLDITIERQYLKAGLKGQEPVFQVRKKNYCIYV
jgi:hypothetical protein